MELIEDYPIATVCQVLDYPRSQVYYEQQGLVDETEIKEAIRVLAGQHPTYGDRRITVMLKRRGHDINHKRVARLMREMGLVGKRPVQRERTTNSNHKFKRYPNLVMNLVIERPDQVWVGDITYIKLQQEFVYLAVLMDVFTRSIRGWHLARSMDQSLTITALNKGLEKGYPEIHHSDQGVQFLEDVYMRKRIHSSLGYLTPDEYEQKWNEQKKKNHDTNKES